MVTEHRYASKSKGFRTVRGRTLATLLPVFLATLLLISGFSYLYAKQIVQNTIEGRMEARIAEVSKQVTGDLDKHIQMPDAAARAVENQPGAYSLEQYRQLFTHLLQVNRDTFGMGIFFQPGKYAAGTPYFSTYAYRDGDKVATTEQYSDPSYDYPKQQWYLNGMKAKAITPPYHDSRLNIDMMTVAVPFYAKDQSLLGIVTADMDLSTIQSYVKNAKVGSGGWATLYDGSGTWIAGAETVGQADTEGSSSKQQGEPLTLQKSANPELAALSGQLLSGQDGATSYQDAHDTYRLFYRHLPGTDWVLTLTVPESAMFAPLKQLLLWVSVISLGGIAAAVVAVLLYSRTITRNLSKVNLLARTLAGGDLTSQVAITGRDEFADMAGHLNEMARNLRGLMDRIAETSREVAGASERLSQSSDESSKATESVVIAIQEVASSSETQRTSVAEASLALEEMEQGVRRIVDGSLEASHTTEDLSTKAQNGGERMREASSFMQLMEQQAASVLDRISALDQQSQEIGNIAALIAEISGQTNLLALNASIEAARSGEHGRGFAVVAQEVKKLAERSEEATRQIGQLLREIAEENKGAVHAVSENTAGIGQGAALVAEAEGIFREINSGLSEITKQSLEISASSQQLMAGTEQVRSNVEGLARIASSTADHAQTVAAASEQQLASMEEIAASSIELSDMAEGLQEQVSRFNVK
ncbi:hypothetical protein B9G55_12350 [Saccharibacillus sp. O16]|nr:hypothetical protein B9G55_12350 [Saccharibacillus sp. O16]